MTEENMAEKKDVIDVADFFTTTRAKEGVWYEPEIDGIGIGLEFRIYGQASDKYVRSLDAYAKEHDRALKETDPGAATEIERQALADRAATIVGGVRAKGGKALVYGKKEFKGTYEEIRSVMYENEDICIDILTAAAKNTTFMKRR